jgi:hypothetical protein
MGVDWIYLIYDKNRRALEHCSESSGSIKRSVCLELLSQGGEVDVRN